MKPVNTESERNLRCLLVEEARSVREAEVIQADLLRRIAPKFFSPAFFKFAIRQAKKADARRGRLDRALAELREDSGGGDATTVKDTVRECELALRSHCSLDRDESLVRIIQKMKKYQALSYKGLITSAEMFKEAEALGCLKASYIEEAAASRLIDRILCPFRAAA